MSSLLSQRLISKIVQKPARPVCLSSLKCFCLFSFEENCCHMMWHMLRHKCKCCSGVSIGLITFRDKYAYMFRGHEVNRLGITVSGAIIFITAAAITFFTYHFFFFLFLLGWHIQASPTPPTWRLLAVRPINIFSKRHPTCIFFTC